EEYHNNFTQIYNVDTDKNIPLNVFDPTIMDAFLKGILTPLLSQGIDSHEELKVTQWMPYNQTKDISVEESMDNILRYLDKIQEDVIKADTQIIILPGYQFHIVKGLITNFHQPKSTLLLLISAFIGDDWKRVYEYAMIHDFRFLSYGDSSLLLRE
ncbi:MAG: S-adenosylmethionine:tRNA ribosyltransferase-isomerase, partial [Bacteroidales bacterium]|nr:S-adenosylmethionine:tRNA ribosyltransferase-isomerase [Bacteroidales bacterium]